MTVPSSQQAAVEPDGGLLAVHAHPDDETLATGALLATWSRAGQRVTVVTCTRGERGEVIDTAAHPTGVGYLEGDGPALAAHREGELARALAALGVADHVFLDTAALPAAGEVPDGGAAPRFEDSGMAWVAPGVASSVAREQLPPRAFVGVPLDEAAARLAAVVRDRRPAVVATYEPGGGYGHPDHVRAHDVTVRALELLDAAGEPAPALWLAVAPESAVRAARRALAAHPAVCALLAADADLTLPDPDEDLPPVARPDASLPTLVGVPVAPVLGELLAAMRAHATQVQHVTAAGSIAGEEPTDLLGWYALSNDVLAPVPSHEFYAPSGGALPGDQVRRGPTR
ncbi:N-acetyl-1-D-myo-inositol-2-amino-2-deoxy-alpha-D-glucopyranoside deacetylase [Cellulosimicrobium cellulans]|uniref:PIG-L family deacetylase n=1 Tax=Cellulosimicrobium cellulans TaxID=1710 RepID=UPI00195E9E5A|nr:PIG-L family deacetylase [Cellulosimicrobium cellulans]MBM7819239.1 N-acetyl-1-D-myo-inositol-2-amino-2-deoxy-alpha-D-glucopyranoside deacetylase [Cellulosimicrobium cellulans]